MHAVNVKGILSAKNGMNLYRGCTHGCIYCDSRSTCYQMYHEFEDVEVKANALPLLEHTLARKRKKGMIGCGAMCDPYIPIEKSLGIVRESMKLALTYGFGYTLITKSNLILRDLDLIQQLHENTRCVVQMTLTTFDESLCNIIEPNVCSTKDRVAVLRILRDMGVPTIVWLCPILPFINDTMENLAGILEACIETKVVGVLCFGMGLTLREGNREYFYRQLDLHFPGLKERYVKTYGNAYVVGSPNQKELMKYFYQTCKEHGIITDHQQIFAYLNHFEQKQKHRQLSLFE